MQTRTLGRTGLEVTTVGFGSITIGGFFGPVDDAESMQALHASVDAGIRFIDTSDAYGAGRSEQIIGRFLRERSDRDQILIICTKGGNDMVTGARNLPPITSVVALKAASNVSGSGSSMCICCTSLGAEP